MSWVKDKAECEERLFDKHHKLPFVVSKQYGRLYLLNQQGEIVISFTEAIDNYDKLQRELDEVKAEYRKYMHEQYLEHSKSEQQLADYHEALEKINQNELNSMRPGGGHSNSAKISYETLKKWKGQGDPASLQRETK